MHNLNPLVAAAAIVSSAHSGAGQLEPTTQAFLDALAAKGGEPIYKLAVPQARQVLEDAQSGPVAKLPVDKQVVTFNDVKAGPVSVTIIRPQGITGTLPALLYIHGAGWVLGSENTHDRLVRQLATGTPAAVVFVNYSRAPEAKFPVQNEQCYAAAKWVVERKNPLVTPLNATLDQLKDLPPALVITDENDVLRDEGEAYARKLMNAGVDVTATRYLGTVHDFVMLNALAVTPAAKAAVAQANEKLHAALYPAQK